MSASPVITFIKLFPAKFEYHKLVWRERELVYVHIIGNLKVTNHFVLPIANPFLSCPVAFYIIRWSNKRSLLNKRTINFFCNRIKKTISVTPGSRPKPITLATAGAICLNWAVTCRIRDQASRHTSTPTTWFGSGAFEDEAEVEGMYSFAVGTINAYGNVLITRMN